MMNIIRICFAGLMLMAASCATMINIPLVKNGKATSCIVLAENADPIEKHAADELALFIKKATGAEVGIEKREVPGLCPIRLGTDAKLEGITDQGFVIKTDGKGLSITGRKPIGVLYGVYDFLEKHVGCRWFAPYDDCEYVPQVKTIQMAANTEDRQSPSFEYRMPTPTGGDVYVGRDRNGARRTWDWMVRNKMQILAGCGPGPDKHHDFLRERGAIISGGGGHLTFVDSVPDDKYFKTNPEYFCLVGGKRIPQGYYGGGCVEAQVCTSNPDVIRLCAEHILKIFKEYAVSICMLGAGDNGLKGNTRWCECENCIKLDSSGSKSIGTRYNVFASAVTRAVHEKNPQAAIGLWAYAQYREPPVGIPIDPNLLILLCTHNRNYKEALATGPSNKKYLKLVEDWLTLTKRVIIRDYFGCGQPMCPAWDALAADLRFYHEKGIIGWEDEESAPDAWYSGKYNTSERPRKWRSGWQYVYLASKMLWDVNLDENKVLAEARALYYGKTAPAMEQYYATLCDAWQKTPGACGWGAVGETFTRGRCLALPGVRDALAKHLAEAEKLAGDDAALKFKIQEEKFFYEEYWIKNYELFIQSNVENPTLTPTNALRPLVLDGQGTDKQWLTAGIYSKLMLTKPGGDRKPANETFVKMMCDDKNIYFLVEAMDKDVKNLKTKCAERDGPVWEDDSVEILIYNQEEWGRYWQFCINSKGVVFDSECAPGMIGNPSFNSNAEIKTAILADRWIVEARITADALGRKSFEGAGWKINVGRARSARSESDPKETSSLSGSGFHDFERFRPLNFGAPLIGNGSFDEAVEPGAQSDFKKWEIKGGKVPAQWHFYPTGGTAELVMRNDKTGDRALYVSNGWIHTSSVSWSRPGESALVSFEAQGECKVNVAVFRYKPRPAAKAQSAGYVFLKTEVIKKIEISSTKWNNYECSYAVPEGEIFALVFMVEGAATLDNVSITPVKKRADLKTEGLQ